VSGLTLKYSEPDEERHMLRLMITGNISTKQASDWLLAFHKVTCHGKSVHFDCFFLGGGVISLKQSVMLIKVDSLAQ